MEQDKQLNQKTIKKIADWIENDVQQSIESYFQGMHHADIGEFISGLKFEQALYIIRILDSETTADVLLELEDDFRKKIFEQLSPEEIAQEVEALDTDDAADIIGEFSEELKSEVISQIGDKVRTKDIVELLRYDEDTAGGIMGKELVKVDENMTVFGCVRAMRSQAASIGKVHVVYVVDDNGILKGRLSLKSLLNHPTGTLIKDVYNKQITIVGVDESKEAVANKMQKYDLFVVPVVDEVGFLVGQITIDDVVDIIREEAEKDYNMAAGISDDITADDSIANLTKARLPWLFLGLLGGIGAAYIMGGFEEVLSQQKVLFFFTPLIAAMAGNVGVQSSAIVVQGLANGTLGQGLMKRLLKELLLALINGASLALLVMGYGALQDYDMVVNYVIGVSLLSVIIIAALVGTFIPILLEKRGIDPALATGPFITTSNDIVGIFLYFVIAKALLGI